MTTRRRFRITLSASVLAVPRGSLAQQPLKGARIGYLYFGSRQIGPALLSVGTTSGYYLFNAAPYALTLAIIIATSSRDRALVGQPR